MWWHPHGRRVYEGLLGILDLLYATSLGRRLRGLWRLLGLLPRMFKVS
jgi:succinate-semialdehyde dehydrogenase/glutarate-semialdehyde dehydrogenase